MAKLKCGHEICDTCGKRYIALLAKDSCMCEIDPSHTDPGEKETALALAERKLKRAGDDNKKLMEAVEYAFKALGESDAIHDCCGKSCHVCNMDEILTPTKGDK